MSKKRVKAHISRSHGTRRQPQQQRAKCTTAAILKAAAEVIDDVGWARASTNRIAEHAGVSIGSLYQYFDSKETILANLIEQHHRSVEETIRSAAQRFISHPRETFYDATRGLFQALIELHREDPVLTRVLATEVPQHRAQKELDIETEQFATMMQQILKHRSDVRVQQTAAAAYILVTVVEALTRWLAHNVPDCLDIDILIEEIAVMMSGYVTGRYPKRKGDGVPKVLTESNSTRSRAQIVR